MPRPRLLLSRLRLAAHQNLVPALLLQVVTVALLCSYAWWPAARHGLQWLMGVKTTWGAVYAFVAGALFAGLVPQLAMHWRGTRRRSSDLVFSMMFWGYRSVEIDFFYRLQAHWFGNAADWPTVAAKTLVDQFVYSPLWAVPGIALAFAWRDAGFDWRRTREQLDREFFTLRLPSAILGNLLVWLPSVVAIYFLPAALQLPVSNLVASFWVLLMTVLLAPKATALKP